MRKPYPYTSEQPGRAASGQMVPQPAPDITSFSRDEVAVAQPVSRSTDLYEKDCEYRGGARLDGGGRLLEVAAHHVLKADRKLQQAAAEGASPSALAAIEQLGLTYSAGAGHLLHNYIVRPQERW